MTEKADKADTDRKTVKQYFTVYTYRLGVRFHYWSRLDTRRKITIAYRSPNLEDFEHFCRDLV